MKKSLEVDRAVLVEKYHGHKQESNVYQKPEYLFI